MLALLLALPAPAAPVRTPEGLPAELVHAVESATGGRVLAAEPAERDGVPGLRFRVLTPDGRVRHVWRPWAGPRERRR
ncbi:MAG: hypothetical protein D6721_10730 [Gammaproteobacteria bacterium]|nr:MAG: hypothetical protein D6721_10730 [Gammaproteobacteria bacterium]